MDPNAERNRSDGVGLGAAAIATGVAGASGVCLPWMPVEFIGIALLIAGFVFSGLALSRERRPWLGFLGLAIAILGTVAGVTTFVVGFVHGYAGAVQGSP